MASTPRTTRGASRETRMPRSAEAGAGAGGTGAGLTVTLSVAESFDGSVSVLVVDALAKFVSVPAFAVLSVTWNAADALAFSVPCVHVTWPLAKTHPLSAETKLAPEGSGSCRCRSPSCRCCRS